MAARHGTPSVAGERRPGAATRGATAEQVLAIGVSTGGPQALNYLTTLYRNGRGVLRSGVHLVDLVQQWTVPALVAGAVQEG